jgi:hypothetical protein
LIPDAILHRTAGIEEFELADQLAGQVAADAREPHHGVSPTASQMESRISSCPVVMPVAILY